MALPVAAEQAPPLAPAPEQAPPLASAPEQALPPAPPPARRPPAQPALTPEQTESNRLATEGLQLLQRGDFDVATQKLQEALQSDPNNVLASTFLGFLAFRNGEMDKARGYCQKAAEVSPNAPLALLLLGRMNEVTGDVAKALEFYARSAQAGAASPTAQTDGGLAIAAHAHYLGSFLQRKAGNSAGALDSLDQTLRVFPKNVNAWYEKGQVLAELSRPAEAVEAFDHALTDRGSWYAPEAWLYPIRRYLFLEENSHYWKAVALRKAGKLPEAAAELATLAPMVAARVGSEIAGSGDGAPLQVLEGEVDLSYYQTHLELARIYSEMGQKGQAVDTLRAYLRIDGLDATRTAQARELMRTVR